MSREEIEVLEVVERIEVGDDVKVIEIIEIVERHHDAPGIHVSIDDEKFSVRESTVTAEALRALPSPPTGPDRDLYLEGRGHREDALVAAGTVVRLKEGMHFFTAPASITNGHAS